MVDTQFTPTSFTKDKPPITSGDATPMVTAYRGKQPRKIFGVDARALGTVLGLTLFFVIAMAGVLIALRNNANQTVAPNAPESNPSAAENQTTNCSVSFTVPGLNCADDCDVNNDLCPDTMTCNDGKCALDTCLEEGANCDADKCEEVSTPTYTCDSECTTDAQCKTANGSYVCSSNRCRLDSNTSSATCTPSTTTTYTCNSDCTTDAQCKTANGSYVCSNNRCRLDSNTSSESCTPSTTTTYTCNSSCTTDSQCQGANAAYICSADNGNRCRLDSNRGSESCTPQVNTYTCDSSCTTNAQCQTANAAYICSDSRCRLDSNPGASNCLSQTQPTPSPTIGCNYTCENNADCTNPAHICYATSDGSKRCRLDQYVNSESCTKPPETYTYTPETPVAVTPGEQPELPAELPQSGPEDWGNWLKAGLAALGIGAVLLLLL